MEKEQDHTQDTYTKEMTEKLWALSEKDREIVAAHMNGVVEGVKIAQALEKKSA